MRDVRYQIDGAGKMTVEASVFGRSSVRKIVLAIGVPLPPAKRQIVPALVVMCDL
jgi:hypothetical protein